MEHKKLRVLIVSKFGAHQKAIQTSCASMPQFEVVDTVADTNQALEAFKFDSPDLIILGANLAEIKVLEFLDQLSSMPNPPYCIALTLSDNDKVFRQHKGTCQTVPTRSFSNQLPEILNEVCAL